MSVSHIVGMPGHHDRLVRCSVGQESLWLAEQLNGRTAAYHGFAAYLVRGTLDVPALERAITTLVHRHDMLRTRIVVEDGVPFLATEHPHDITVRRLDVRRPGASRDNVLADLQASELERPFDLECESPLRVALVRIDDRDEVLLLTVHHMFIDGWSMRVFLRDVAQVYTAFLESRSVDLSLPAARYCDFARWQRDWLETEAARTQLSYWSRQLQGAEPFELLTDRPRAAAPAATGAIRSYTFDPALRRGLKRLSTEHGSTLFMTLLAGFQAVIARWTGRDDGLLGVPVANRTRSDWEETIGFFVNMLVIRADLSGRPAVSELLHRVRQTTIDAFAHQDMPFERVVERLHPNRELGRNPLFQVSFELQTASSDLGRVRLPQLELVRIPLRPRFTRFDVECHVSESQDGLAAWVLYSDELFESSTIDGFIADFQATLIGCADRRGVSAGSTRAQPSSRRPDNHAEIMSRRPVHRVFEDLARQLPDQIAIVGESGRISFAELNRRANSLAEQLLRRGIGPDMLVGVALDRSTELVVAVLAVLKAGAAYVPLDLQHPLERLAALVRQARPRLLLAAPALDAASLGMSDAVLRVTERSHGDPACGASNPNPFLTPDNLAYVIFTSGSTGEPKGVMISHGALTNHMEWIQRAYPLGGSDAVLFRTPPTFDASVLELFWPLVSGSRMVVADTHRQRSGAYLAGLIRTQKVTVAQFVPSLLELMLEDLGRDSLQSLRHLFCGGERLAGSLLAKVAERTTAVLHNLYGPTEACIDATCWDATEPPTSTSAPIGYPIAHTSAYVLDGDGQSMPARALGELHVAGAGLARGYLGDPSLTAAKFIPDPFSAEPGARMYRSGDLCRLRTDGSLEFESRADEQVKLYGHRIELGEVEAVACLHPDTVSAAAVVHDVGGGTSDLACFVVGRSVNPRAAALRDDGSWAQTLSEWQRVHDGTFHSAQNDYPADLNFAGWRSSFTGDAYSEDEMREWRDEFAHRLLAHCSRRVLEIGCGAGMVLQRCAPQCDEYWGTDFSAAALDAAARTSRAFANIRLLKRHADDFTGIPTGYFDAVVLNSVVQYFPSIAYLDAVLRGACAALRRGGVVIVGDVRMLPLLPAFRAEWAARRQSAVDSIRKMEQKISRALATEPELVLHPAAFLDFQRRHRSLVAGVEVYFKRGRARTEMNQYRCDVVLTTTSAESCVRLEERRLDGAVANYHILHSVLAQHAGVVRISDVPNARVMAGWCLADAVATLPRDAQCRRTLEEANACVAETAPVDSESWYDIGAAAGRVTALVWPTSGNARRYDVVFAPDVSSCAAASQLAHEHLLEDMQLATDPSAARKQAELVVKVNALMSARLPAYSRPTRVFVVPALPRTRSGKLDRRELAHWASDWELERPHNQASEPPQTDLETTVLRVWRDVLQADINGDHNFFDAGGHSLLAVQALGRLNAELGIQIPLSALFIHPSPRQFAAWLASQPAAVN